MRRAFVWLLAIVALLAIGAALLRLPPVQDRLVEAVVERALGQSASDLFTEDALRVLVCGSSSPFPHPTRAKPCLAVFAAGRLWVVDTGPGSWNRLALWRIPGRRIGAVLLTHFHSDHIGDLGEFDLQTWVDGRSGPLQVFGPVGVERVVAGFEEAYALDTSYRIIHHGSELLPADVGRMQARSISFPAGGPQPVTIFDADGLRITAFEVDHRPVVPAIGYRFDFGGRSVVVSGDTVPVPGLVEVARGADVLVHEAQANHMVATIGAAADRAGRSRAAKIMSDIPDYHTTPVEAAGVANEAGVDLLLFTHLTPPPPNAIAASVFVRGVSDVRPDGWFMADDGHLVELPIDSEEIIVRKLP
jgi:ribonuclease Z